MSAIFKWMIVLVLLLVAAGGGGLYWFNVRSDEMLRTEVLKQLANLSPDLKFRVERANFDFSGRIRLFGLSIQLPEDVEPALYVPEAVVTLDNQQLTDFEKVTIQRLRFVNPEMHVVRRRDGGWNWQGIAWQKSNSQTIPEVDVEHATIYVELQRDQRSARKLKLADLNLTSVPAAARRVTAVLSTRIEPAGPLSATITADLDGPPFKLEAKWLRLPVDDELLDLIGELSPAVNGKLNDARLALAKMAATQVAAVSITPGVPGNSSVPGGFQGVATSPVSLRSQIEIEKPALRPFGVKCNCDLHCRLEWTATDTPLQYQVLAELSSGQFSNQVLPFPLYEIHGSFYADPGQVMIRDLRAENGPTRLFVNTRIAPGQVPKIQMQVRNLRIDEPLKARLPEAVRKLINSFSLMGVCDLDFGTAKDSQVLAWEGDLRLSDGSIAHEKFPYPIRDVVGTVRMRGKRLDINGQGKASGGVPVSLTGWVQNPGPEHEMEFLVKADGIPINSTLMQASPDAIRKAMTELGLQGFQDVRTRFFKAAGVGNKVRMTSRVRFRDCSCTLRSFPYRIQRLQGLAVADDDLIVFEELKGEHDETRLTATGRYYKTPAPGRLELTIRAENAAFDRSLEAALPPSVQRLWKEFQPVGRFDVDSEITWVPQQPCRVVLPRIKILDAEVTMRSFPWPLRSVQGELSYEAPRVVMKSISAQHDDTQIRGRGLVAFPPGEPWRVRFDEIHVDDLMPTSTFRKALPLQLQRTFDTLMPTGKFSVGTTRQGIVEIEATPDGAGIASSWDVDLLLAGCALTAGVRIDDIHGRIGLKGGCDGKTTRFTGQLDLDSISVFRQPSGLAHQISRVVGPIKMHDGVFTGGSGELASPQPPSKPPHLSERISGDAIDGKLTLDVVADLREEPDYKLQVTLSRGRLESYAQQYLRGQSGLAGVMNGWLFLWGRGKSEEQIKGRGALQIAPAAIYELPVFVKIFQALRLDAVDRTAFERADVLYHIDNSRFSFDTIDLVGNAISLRGRGYVRFDGAMQFDFYSMLAKNQVRIPVIHEIAGMLSRGWVGVKVWGHVGAPQTRIIPVPEVDAALKQFLGTFEPSQAKQRQKAGPFQYFQP